MGSSVEELRELIAVRARIESVMRAYARTFPEEAAMVIRALRFRQAVALQFERLVREGVPIAELPEVEESELDATEETYAGAPWATRLKPTQARSHDTWGELRILWGEWLAVRSRGAAWQQTTLFR